MTYTAVSLSAQIQVRPRTNLLLLVLGFGLGQGSLFLSQSYLILQQAYELTVTFSLGFALTVLGALVVDSGGIVLLARRCVAVSRDGGDSRKLHSYFSALVAVRLLVWILLSCSVLLYASLSEDPSRYFFIPAMLGMLAWCFNCAGVLDGLSLSGFSGLAAACPFVACAAVLPFLASASLEQAALAAGTAYAAGLVLGLALQHALLHRAGVRLPLSWPAWAGFSAAARESFSFQLSFLPGQLLYRGQLALANLILPVQGAALFIYGKQAANAAQQIAGFARRAAFPALVRRCSGGSFPAPLEILKIQKSSFLITAAIVLPMFLAVVLQAPAFPGWVRDISFALSLVAPGVASAALYSAFGQSLQAAGAFLPLAWLAVPVTATGLIGAAVLGGWIGVQGFVWAEVCAHFAGVLLMIVHIRQLSRG